MRRAGWVGGRRAGPAWVLECEPAETLGKALREGGLRGGSSGPGSAIQARGLPSPSPPIAHCYTLFRAETPAPPAAPRPRASKRSQLAPARQPSPWI